MSARPRLVAEDIISNHCLAPVETDEKNRVQDLLREDSLELNSDTIGGYFHRQGIAKWSSNNDLESVDQGRRHGTTVSCRVAPPVDLVAGSAYRKNCLFVLKMD